MTRRLWVSVLLLVTGFGWAFAQQTGSVGALRGRTNSNGELMTNIGTGDGVTLSSGRIPVLADINNGSAVTARNNAIVEGGVAAGSDGSALNPVPVVPSWPYAVTDTLTSATDSAVITLGGRAGVAAVITGTWVATLFAHCSADDGTSWVQTDFFDRSVGTSAIAIAANGTYTLGWTGGGMTQCRVYANAYTSGTVTVRLVATWQPMEIMQLFSQGEGGVPPLNGVVTALERADTGTIDYLKGDSRGALFTNPTHPDRWDCDLDNIGTTLTECQAAPGASLSLYVMGYMAGSTTATAGQHMLRYGTGTNCGTGTTTLFPGTGTTPRVPSPLNTGEPTIVTFPMAIKVPTNTALCVLGVATNTTWIVINGYTAP